MADLKKLNKKKPTSKKKAIIFAESPKFKGFSYQMMDEDLPEDMQKLADEYYDHLYRVGRMRDDLLSAGVTEDEATERLDNFDWLSPDGGVGDYMNNINNVVSSRSRIKNLTDAREDINIKKN